jgi:3-oxoacyl-[acyl-carrier-protein] synthase II
MAARIAVTGIGMLTPLGCTPLQVLENLRLGRSGIRPIQSFDAQSFVTQYAGEVTELAVDDYFSPREQMELDRGTQMGIVAAQQAWDSAGIPQVDPERVGLVVGMTGAGQYQNAHFSRSRKMVELPEVSFFHIRNLSHFQTTVIARRLHIQGPSLTFTCASAGSTYAIGHGMSLLSSGRADIVVAGGSEALTVSSALAMDTLQLCSPASCSPFSGTPGMTLGEGAAYFVLEKYDQACDRGANVLAELLGYASRGDAYDSIASDPSGQGIARAMSAALRQSGIGAEQIEWIKASGCSTRDQDPAETIAIRQVFGDNAKIPPVTSLESSFGHANGASGAIGLAAAILCRKGSIIPATLHFSGPRAGCDLDYVPNQPRSATMNYFVSNSIAFGGGNSSLVVAAPQRQRAARKSRSSTIAITGIGLISPVGCSTDSFLGALRQQRSGIADVERFNTEGLRVKRAGLVKDLPDGIPELRRLASLQRFATAAVAGALADAGLLSHRLPPERIGLVVALSRGPGAAQEYFFKTFCSGHRTPAIGKAMLKTGRFYVTSTLAQCFQLRGFGATISEGTTAGLHALVHARDMLSQDDEHDALIVVAADELSALFMRIAQDSGLLASDDDCLAETLCPYDLKSRGTIMGEGAVAMVIERLDCARKRNAPIHASVRGCGLTNDGQGYLQLEHDGKQFGRAIDLALEESALDAGQIDLVYGHGRGIPCYDRREINALQARFESTPVSCVIGNLGVAEASCGLFSVAAAALGMQRNEAYPVASKGNLNPSLSFVTGHRQEFFQKNVLVTGGTESGNNAALVLSRDGLAA